MSLKDKVIDTLNEEAKYLTAKKIYDIAFKRYEKMNYLLEPGLININRINIKRIEKLIDVSNYKLMTYYYPNNSNKLIIFSHGLMASADDLLPFINYFYNHGYSCYSFDIKGVGNSTGYNSVGIFEALVDLDNILNYIKKDNELNKKEIYLFGHSAGAYAVCAILNLHKEIKKVVSISGFNDAYNLIVNKGEFYGGKFAGLPKKYIYRYQDELFKEYTKYNAVDGINNIDAKIFLAHAKLDFIIDYDNDSIIKEKDNIKNKNVIYYIDSLNGHTSILYNEDSNIYRKKIDSKIKKMTEEERIKYISNIDHELYSKINIILFEKILKFYED